ncbi:MAG: metal-dependent hydrolase [Firmicutes bacterium]|nr:metal-dependent hydrolase [Bacillota bacterium]
MRARFWGHAFVEVIGQDGSSILIDPFVTGNPQAEGAGARPDAFKPRAILLTHGHGAHLGDALALARASGATVVAPFELAMYCQRHGATVHPMHIGGSRHFGWGWVKLTPAWHGSAAEEDGQTVYTGNPCGYLVQLDGKTLYHSGDTALFGDMALIGQRHPIDVAFVPIGDNFTMGPDDALYALSLLKPRLAVPMHYDTFDVIRQDPQAFAVRARQSGVEVRVLRPGEALEV